MKATHLLGLVGALALALTTEPALAQGEPAALPMPSMEERTAAFGEIDEAVKASDQARAADLLLALTQDPAHEAFHAEAWARLGSTLEALGYPYAALHAYARGLEVDADMVSSVAAPALKLADDLGDTALLQPVFAGNVGIDVDDATRGRVAYLAARQAHAEGKHSTAVAFLKMVPASSPDYAEAKALEGVVLAHTNRYTDGVAALQIALAAGAQRDDADRWANMINLNIGRAYYGAGEFVRAIEYFAKVDRDSSYWAEAQFERAWAHFRLDDLNGALGLLYTHSSPFFAGEYFPEAALLEIYSLFLLCKFPAAGEHIDEFQARFSTMASTLRDVTAQEPEKLFEVARADVASSKTPTLPSMVVRPLRQDDRFAEGIAAIQRIDAELSRLRGASGGWSQAAAGWLETRRSDLVQSEGRRIRDRARAMEDELTAMLANSEMNKLDILQMESRMYERASHTGVMEKARRTVDRGVRVRDGYRWWPYEGEYWADELGWYRIDTAPECPESLRSGE